MVYVINKSGNPLMPCENVVARLLLKHFTIKLLYEWGKSFRLPLAKRLGGPQSRSEHFEKVLLLLPAVTPLFSGFPVRSLVTTLTVAYPRSHSASVSNLRVTFDAPAVQQSKLTQGHKGRLYDGMAHSSGCVLTRPHVL
jgi:hypothetical protein